MTNNDKIVAIVTSIAVICISLTVIFCDTLVLAVGVPTLVLLWLVFLGWINNKKLDKGEMRRAITGSIVIAFFIILIAISKNPDIYSNNKEIFSLFLEWLLHNRLLFRIQKWKRIKKFIRKRINYIKKGISLQSSLFRLQRFCL